MAEFARKHVAFKAAKVDEAGTFSGYASVFGNADSYGEIVAPGAFAESIKRIKSSGDPLPVLWQHRSDQPIGWSDGDQLAEDEHGLKVDGTLMIGDIPLAKQAHALMTRRVVKGLSIGYYVEESSFNEKTGIRTLQKLDLVEYSPVTFAANPLAQVDAVKSMLRDGRLPTLKAFEDFLRESGFSRTQAAAIAGGGLAKLHQSESDSTKAALQVVDLLSSFKIT